MSQISLLNKFLYYSYAIGMTRFTSVVYTYYLTFYTLLTAASACLEMKIVGA